MMRWRRRGGKKEPVLGSLHQVRDIPKGGRLVADSKGLQDSDQVTVVTPPEWLMTDKSVRPQHPFTLYFLLRLHHTEQLARESVSIF
jgi:hypothetical protein